ncbi:MAG: magnesium transporter [Candidatus Uhrbacteria bacterium]|nr:magnesium transporter [Candidatus Uhrbacteria bacterium]
MKIISKNNRYIEEDVVLGRIDHLIEHRVPWLMVGLLVGLLSAVMVSKFHAILSENVQLAYFIPIIVYLSDAVGTQTETIYIRTLSKNKKINLYKYIAKESAIGLGLGISSGLILAVFAMLWMNSFEIGLVIGLSMIVNLTLAPVLATFIPSLLYKRKSDPALGSGPLATIIQDLISLLVYFTIAGIVIL